MLYFLVLLVIIILLSLTIAGFYYRSGSGTCICKNKLHGKTAIITCATSGTSRETALNLASRGARIILACSDVDEGESIKDAIVSETCNENIVVKQLDFSDLYSVRKFAEDIMAKEHRIDILLNNSGKNFISRQESKQEFELTLCENFYGPFLLTNLLLEKMVEHPPCRIINVTSMAHKSFHLDLGDIHFKRRKYNPYASFAQSELCSVLFTKELSHRLVGRGVTANAVYPGLVLYEVLSENSILGFVVNLVGFLAFKTPLQGAQSIIHLAVSDKLEKVTGEYFVDCKVTEPSKKALDPHLARELWEFTEEEVGLQNEETNL